MKKSRNLTVELFSFFCKEIADQIEIANLNFADLLTGLVKPENPKYLQKVMKREVLHGPQKRECTLKETMTEITQNGNMNIPTD